MKTKQLTFCILFTILFLGGCTLRLGGPNKVPATPAPTSIPLSEVAQPTIASDLVPPGKPITLPPGFVIHVYADGRDSPRMMAIGPDKMLYVAERGANRVIRLPDLDQNGQQTPCKLWRKT